MDTGFDTDAALIERSFSTPEEFGGIYQRHGGAIAAFVLRRVDGGAHALRTSSPTSSLLPSAVAASMT